MNTFNEHSYFHLNSKHIIGFVFAFVFIKSKVFIFVPLVFHQSLRRGER